jgi:signal peptidase I
MSIYLWFVFFLFVQIVLLGTWKLYEAAGRKRWEAGIHYNAIVLMKTLLGPCYFYSNYKPHYVSSNLD